MSKSVRQAISKTTRFEIFKRDAFKCQYCGAAAPTSILHVDHIEPISKGGTNDLTNLITSCEGCNLGKSDRPLSEHSAVEKSRAQMDALHERREQLEMMMQWRKGLRELDKEVTDRIAAYWNECVPGSFLTDSGKTSLQKLLDKFGHQAVCEAMDRVSRTYVKFNNEGRATDDSAALAFSKVGSICHVNKLSETNPDLKELLYIRGILRNRIPGYFVPHKALEWLKAARSWGVDVIELKDIALSVRNWTTFRQAIEDVIAERKNQHDQL